MGLIKINDILQERLMRHISSLRANLLVEGICMYPEVQRLEESINAGA